MDIRYHIQNREGKFLCDDKHAGESWFGEFSDPFVCRFGSIREALRYRENNCIRVSIEGTLI